MPVQALFDFPSPPAASPPHPLVSTPTAPPSRKSSRASRASRVSHTPAPHDAPQPPLFTSLPLPEVGPPQVLPNGRALPAADGTVTNDYHHGSEIEFSSLLDYYGIEWQYEPHQFPLQWRDGRPTEMFTPDFYLPEYDLYIELTTMRQSLVRRKNRKLRLLRALYPDINIKLLYRRDYQRLLERFGIRPEAEIPEADEPRSGEASD